MKIQKNTLRENQLNNIKEILKQADLMGLIKIGAPNDEYDHEAKELWMAITHLSKAGFIQKVLYNIFYNSFGCNFKLIGSYSKYKLPAQQIHDILKK